MARRGDASTLAEQLGDADLVYRDPPGAAATMRDRTPLVVSAHA